MVLEPNIGLYGKNDVGPQWGWIVRSHDRIERRMKHFKTLRGSPKRTIFASNELELNKALVYLEASSR